MAGLQLSLLLQVDADAEKKEASCAADTSPGTGGKGGSWLRASSFGSAGNRVNQNPNRNELLLSLLPQTVED